MGYEYTISQLEELIDFIEDGIDDDNEKELKEKVREVNRAISILSELS